MARPPKRVAWVGRTCSGVNVKRPFDAALLRSLGGTASLVDVVGDDTLGGHVIDGDIVRWLCDRYGIELKAAGEAELRRAVYLDTAARALKHELSEQRSASYFLPDPPLELLLTAADLATIVRDVVEPTLEACSAMLDRNELRWEGISGVIFAGAGTRSPAVRELVAARAQVRDGTTIPELAVVVGLASPTFSQGHAAGTAPVPKSMPRRYPA